MSIQTAPFISPAHKALLHGAGFTSTWQVARATPVELWRLVTAAAKGDRSDGADFSSAVPLADGAAATSNTQEAGSGAAGGVGRSDVPTLSSVSSPFSLKVAAMLVEVCQGAERRTRLALYPSASSDSEISTAMSEGAPPPPPLTCTPAAVCSPTPLCSVAGLDDDDGEARGGPSHNGRVSQASGLLSLQPTPVVAIATTGGAFAAQPENAPNAMSISSQFKGTSSSSASARPLFTAKTMTQLLREEEEGISSGGGGDRQPSATSGAPTAAVSASVGKRIVTFSEAVDDLCGGGGIECGCVTELCGSPGMGKTQLAMQLAVAAQLPQSFGGLEGECLYIDTEGSFVPSRFAEIANGAAAQVQKILALRERQRLQRGAAMAAAAASSDGASANNDTPPFADPSSPLVPDGGINGPNNANGFTATSIMSRVHYIRITRLADLLALIEALPTGAEALAERNHNNNRRKNKTINGHNNSGSHNSASGVSSEARRPIRLVVIDSIAFHFRSALGGDAQLRSRTLFHVGMTLQRHAAAMGAAVVVTNQLTSTSSGPSWGAAAGEDAGGGGSTLGGVRRQKQQPTPALGESWAHTLTYRFMIQQPSPLVAHRAVAAIAAAAAGANSGGHNNQHFQQQQQQQAVAAILADQSVRSLSVLKSPTRGRASSLFRITAKGIRNVNIAL